MKILAPAALLLVMLGGPAWGDDEHVTSDNTSFVASVMDAQAGSSASQIATGGGDPVVETFTEPVCAPGGAQVCAGVDTCDDGSVMTVTTYVSASGVVTSGGNNCPAVGVPPAGAEITPGLVLQAFQRIPLPEAPLIIQPPNGRTLVNFKTNFYTEQGEFTRTVTLLGRQVELRIWPASFTWQFGDGESLQSTEPGAKYPDLEITHEYLTKGRVAPSVDTTYTAQFRVDGGAWQQVQGTVTIPGSPQGLRVVEARPVLVGG